MTEIKPNEDAIEARKERVEKDLETAPQKGAMQQEILNIGDESIHTEMAVVFRSICLSD